MLYLLQTLCISSRIDDSLEVIDADGRRRWVEENEEWQWSVKDLSLPCHIYTHTRTYSIEWKFSPTLFGWVLLHTNAFKLFKSRSCYTHTYIYIYIERERERKKDWKNMTRCKKKKNGKLDEPKHRKRIQINISSLFHQRLLQYVGHFVVISNKRK